MKSFLLGAKTEVQTVFDVTDYVGWGGEDIVLMFDGIRNAGFDQPHADTLPKMIELVSGNQCYSWSGNPTWDTNSLTFGCNYISKNGNPRLGRFIDGTTNQMTLEYCMTISDYADIGTNPRTLFKINNENVQLIYLNINRKQNSWSFACSDVNSYWVSTPSSEYGGVHTVTNVCDWESNTFSVYFDGDLVASRECQSVIAEGTSAEFYNNWIANDTTKTYSRQFNARLYSRVLTAQEIAHNYAIDQRRFGL